MIMGRLMIFYNEIDTLESVIRAHLRDSRYDHMIFAEVMGEGEGAIDELVDVCEKWGINYEVTDRSGGRTDVKIGTSGGAV